MKPPMNESITIKNPVLDEQGNPIKDSYGRPKLETDTSNARVQYSTKVVRGTDGQTYETSLEVDLPPDAKVGYQTETSYTDKFNNKVEGRVLAVNESTNLAGTRVYFRTVNIG